MFTCYVTDIMNRKARLAWELYLKMETSGESFSLLQLIANDCYKVNTLCCLDVIETTYLAMSFKLSGEEMFNWNYKSSTLMKMFRTD